MQPLVTPEEHRAGFKSLPLEYHAGEPRPGEPAEILLTAPPRWRAKELRLEVQALLNAGDREAFLPVLLACLPERYASAEFVQSLDMDCEAMLSATALCLAFGNATQKKILEAMDLAMTSLQNLGRKSPSSEPATAPER
jgi:hypothetical protein